jgi:hypothetical protein
VRFYRWHCHPGLHFLGVPHSRGRRPALFSRHWAADSSTEIYIRDTNHGANGPDVFQTRISYASKPREDKRNNLFVSAEVSHPRLVMATINLPNEALRDYFYVGDRLRAWEQQASFYELLKVDCHASPAELRLAFKLRTLELRTAQVPHSNCAALERAFNILARPELRACYDALLGDPASPHAFPIRRIWLPACCGP